MIETMQTGGPEDREEGEIVDDDSDINVFEDISDYSIHSPSNSGKSVSTHGLLQDVSLSSISNSEVEDILDMKNGKKNRKRKKMSKCYRSKGRRESGEYYGGVYRKHKRRNSSGDSDRNKLDHRTLRQLKEAIRINTSREVEQKSLRTRLQTMLNHNHVQKPVEEEEIETLRTLALFSTSRIEEEGMKFESEKELETNENNVVEKDDEELIELRLAALKSAIMKKALERKKRKENGIDKENDVNRENNKDEVIVISDAGSNESGSEVISKEAVLIAPIDKKILTENNKEMVNSSLEEDVDIMRAMLLASMSKRITSNVRIPIEKNLSKKQTFPMQKKSNFKNPNFPVVKPLIIKLGNESDSDIDTVDKQEEGSNKDRQLVDTVTQFLKRQRAVVEAKLKHQNGMNKEPSLDKSVVKLLPKTQQREYQLLKQKLLMAKKKRLRKTSYKSDNRMTKKFVRIKTQHAATNAQVNLSKQDVDLVQLQKTLEDMQIKKDGRLQMKGKYKELAPLLRKVNQASINRKLYETEIKKLLEDLQKARKGLAVAHQDFFDLTKTLITEKDAIDRRPNKTSENEVAIVPNGVQCTSTPIKLDVKESVCDVTFIDDLSSITYATKVDDAVSSKVHVVDVVPDEVGDVVTNEIMQYNSDCELLVKKYVSPLDTKNRDNIVSNPLATFCPYELFGICKDAECKFNHCERG